MKPETKQIIVMAIIAMIIATATFLLTRDWKPMTIIIFSKAEAKAPDPNRFCGLNTVRCPGEPKSEIVKVEKTIEEKILEKFGKDGKIFLAIAKGESGLNPESKSVTDITKDGRPFSIGVFQINLTVHNIGGLNCPTAFSGKDHRAVIVDGELYNRCVKTASDPDININKAFQIYTYQGLSAWGAYTNKSYLSHF